MKFLPMCLVQYYSYCYHFLLMFKNPLLPRPCCSVRARCLSIVSDSILFPLPSSYSSVQFCFILFPYLSHLPSYNIPFYVQLCLLLTSLSPLSTEPYKTPFQGHSFPFCFPIPSPYIFSFYLSYLFLFFCFSSYFILCDAVFLPTMLFNFPLQHLNSCRKQPL